MAMRREVARSDLITIEVGADYDMSEWNLLSIPEDIHVAGANFFAFVRTISASVAFLARRRIFGACSVSKLR